jgi:hypothetical protein
VIRSHRELIEVTTVFPFDFFPDTIRIDENKIDIIYRNFYFVKHIVPILVEDIATVILSSGVFFASIHVQLNKPRPPERDPFLSQPMNYFWKRDAIKVRRIILGLVVAKKEKIDLAKIPTVELIPKIEEIGKAREYPSN